MGLALGALSACVPDLPECLQDQDCRDEQQCSVNKACVPKPRLTVVVSGAGSVVSTPSVLSCPGVCQSHFSAGSVVTLVASADTRARFGEWGGCDAVDATACTVTVTEDRTIRASFVDRVSLRVQLEGQGTVTSTPTGIDCGDTCVADFDKSMPVTLSADPASSWRFDGWTGAGCGRDGTCALVLEADAVLDANFQELTSMAISVGAGGTVTASAAGLAPCTQMDSPCDRTVDVGAQVRLVAEPDRDWRFREWGGACGDFEDAAACRLVVGRGMSVSAAFTQTRELTVATISDGEVHISVDGDVLSQCSGCTEQVDFGDRVSLRAEASGGHRFIDWMGDCVGQGNPCTLTVASSLSVTAVFDPEHSVNVSVLDERDLPMPIPAQEMVTVTSSPAGIRCPQTSCGGLFLESATATLSAASSTDDYRFLAWDLGPCAASGAAPTCAFRPRGQTLVYARFARRFLLSAERSLVGPASGQILERSSAPEIDCGTTCQARFDRGQAVLLEAQPGGDSDFVRWEGCSPGSGTTCTATMTRARQATAVFIRNWQVRVSSAGSGSGRVVDDQGGIDCGTTCVTSVQHGADLTLTASASVGSRFEGWTDCPDANGVNCALASAAADHDIRPTFIRQHLLDLTVVGPGTVTSTVGPIDCGGACPTRIDDQVLVTLTAEPSLDARLVGWTGDWCSGAALTCVVPMDRARTVTARFKQRYRLTTTSTGPGTIQRANGANGTCGSGCFLYDFDQTVELTATPAGDARFIAWAGACTGTASTCSVPMSEERTVTASFLQRYRLTVTSTGPGALDRDVAEDGTCGPGCYMYPAGTDVRVSSLPGTDARFAGWAGSTCSGSASTCLVAMTSPVIVSAAFVQQYRLATAVSGPGGLDLSPPPNESCGAECHLYDAGTLVVLSATLGADMRFDAWGDDCAGSGATCSLSMSAARIGSATFVPQYRLTVQITGSGTVQRDIAENGSCGANCYLYDPTDTVTLTATPGGGASFLGWGGDCTGSADCSVTMSSARNVTATFDLPVSVSFDVVSQSLPGIVSGASADIDNDGDVDFVGFTRNGTNIDIYRNRGGGNFDTETHSVGFTMLSIAVGDLDGDGDADIVHSRNNTGGGRALRNDGTGRFTDAGFEIGTSDRSNYEFYRMYIQDVDDDGQNEVITGADAGIHVWRHAGNLQFTQATGGPLGSGSVPHIAFTDIELDSDVDMVVISSSSNHSGEIRAFLNTGDGTFVRDPSQTLLPSVGEGCHIVAADLDGDGDEEIIVAQVPSPIAVRVFDNVAGLLTPAETFETRTRSLAAGDVDGDGFTDVIRALDSSAQLLVNDQTGTLSESLSVASAGALREYVDAVDLDSDGDADGFACGASDCTAFLTSSGVVDAPVSRWRFDEGSGTSASDAAGGHHGTLTGAGWGSGRSGTGVELNGSGQGVTIPYAADLAVRDAFTFTAWVRGNTVDTGEQHIYSGAQTGAGVDPWELKLATGNLTLTLEGTRGASAVASRPLDSNKWHHVAATFDRHLRAADAKVFVDGVMVGMTPFPQRLLELDHAVSIGGLLPGFSNTFDGVVDEVSVWHRAMTSDQVFADDCLILDVGELCDDFERADGAPGAGWTAVTGAWTIVDGQLQAQGHNGAGSGGAANQDPIIVRSVGYRTAFDARVSVIFDDDRVRPSLRVNDTNATSLDGLEVYLESDTDMVHLRRDGPAIASQSLPLEPNVEYELRLTYDGTDLSATVWVAGSPQPASPTVTVATGLGSSVDTHLALGANIAGSTTRTLLWNNLVITSPASACADGTAEIAQPYFGRDDIAFCDGAGMTMPARGDAEGLCGTGWHLCTAGEWVARNDTCTQDQTFVGWIDDGQDCAVVPIDGSPNEECRGDARLDSAPGTCTVGPLVSASGPYTMAGGAVGTYCPATPWRNSGWCGSVCCRDTPAIARWRFDEGSGTTALDSVGTHHSTIYNATYASGPRGTSLSFGGNAHVRIPQSSDFNPSDGVTISAWVNRSTPATGSNEGIFNTHCPGGANDPFRLEIDQSGGVTFRVEGSPTNASVSSTPIDANRWYHVAGTWDASSSTDNVRLVVDGATADTGSFPATPDLADHELSIGSFLGGNGANSCANPAPDDFFNGRIDEVEFWGRALSDEEIQRELVRTDPTTGLSWQSIPAASDMTWQPAVDYCNALSLAGFDDWRLPTIDELRSVIRGCAGTVTGGACGVTAGCLTEACRNADPSCVAGCTAASGPTDSCYWEGGLVGGCTTIPYWSSSERADDTSYAWFVEFGTAQVSDGHKTGGNPRKVRCVRGGDRCPGASVVAHWPLDGGFAESSGSVTATPMVVGSPTPTSDRFGAAGSAMAFDGDDGAVLWSDRASSNFRFGDEFTIEMWIRDNSAPNICGGGDLAMLLTAGTDVQGVGGPRLYQCFTGLDFAVSGGGVDPTRRYCDSPSGTSCATVTVNDDTWHHIAGVRDGHDLFLYFDGAFVGSFVDNSMLPPGFDVGNPIRLMHRFGPTFFATGALDDIIIHDAACGSAYVASRASQR